MEKLLVFVLVLAFMVGMVLGVWWLIWSLWSWVIPQIWPTGPEVIIHPSYWLFAGLWVLLSLIGKVIFGRSDK